MRILNLIDDAAGPVNARELSSLFDALDAVEPADLVGDWSGGDFHDNENGQNGAAVVPEGAVERTVHPCHAMLESYRWAGVVVESLENAMPVMTWTDEGKRVESEYWGRAQVRAVCVRLHFFYLFFYVFFFNSTCVGLVPFRSTGFRQSRRLFDRGLLPFFCFLRGMIGRERKHVLRCMHAYRVSSLFPK